MKRKLITFSVLLLSGSSLFAQEVTGIPAFNSDAEKEAWIKAHPKEYEKVAGEKVSGENNPAIPTFSSSEEKEQWIKNNPDLYRSMGGSQEVVSEVNKLEANKASDQEAKLKVNLDKPLTAPEFRSEEEKAAWIKEHEAELKAMEERQKEAKAVSDAQLQLIQVSPVNNGNVELKTEKP